MNRRFSQPLSVCILRIWPNCNPNFISVISAIIGFIGALAIWGFQPVLGGIFVQVSSILDGSDGEIARAKGRETYFGGFFDSILDRYVDFSILTAMAFFSFRILSPVVVLLLATTSVTGSFLVSYTAAKAEASSELQFSRTIQGRDTRLLLIFLAGLSSIFTFWSIPICLILITLLTHGAVFLRIKHVKNSL